MAAQAHLKKILDYLYQLLKDTALLAILRHFEKDFILLKAVTILNIEQ